VSDPSWHGPGEATANLAMTVEELRHERDEAIRERDEARAIAREILTSRPAYDPIGWKQRAPWLDETNIETT